MASIGGQWLEAARICTRTPLPTVKAVDRSRCCELHRLRAGSSVTTAYITRELAYRTDRTHAPVSRRSSRGARRFSAILPPAAANIGWARRARRAGPKDSWEDRASKRSERASELDVHSNVVRVGARTPIGLASMSKIHAIAVLTVHTADGHRYYKADLLSILRLVQRVIIPESRPAGTPALHCPTTGQPPRAWMDDPEPCMCVAS